VLGMEDGQCARNPISKLPQRTESSADEPPRSKISTWGLVCVRTDALPLIDIR